MIEEHISTGRLALNVKYSFNGKPVVLFLHFSGGNLHMWEGILPQFQQEFSVIAPDLRGHGRSDKPQAGYHIDEMAEDVHLLLQQLGIRECHVVGSSMGAEVGLSLAAAHPGLVKSLVCEGALHNEFGEYGIFQGNAEDIERRQAEIRGELAEREERVFAEAEEYIAEMRAELTAEGLWNEYFSAFYEHSLQPLPDGSYTYCYRNHVRNEYIEQYWELAFEDYYQRLTCPVLFLPSEDEWNNPAVRSSLDSFAAMVNSSEIKRIPGSIHAYVWMQLPQQAGQAVKDFLAEQL
ncbi:alpha/beta hydrolase [Paenibacillus sp. MMS20-IR301]|uniref:alpha/beta fold hydrolase n=1 Tax=Paenibacillus sp. MMS20-IR301 TaxID=2895946 RepID=UPI0028EE1772|nr:alpha/beta hydrolase [Paenibacillus sp. MMS20-IR301]WNS44662.1 alpha/beta hydrolase [Paenibacillus sp. MMS20-IR301]